MITTVNELICELEKLNRDNFIIAYNIEEKADLAIENIAEHIEADRRYYELRIGKNVS